MLKCQIHTKQEYLVDVCNRLALQLDRTHLTPNAPLHSAGQPLHVRACEFYTRLGRLHFTNSHPICLGGIWERSRRGCDMSSVEIKVYYIWLFPPARRDFDNSYSQTTAVWISLSRRERGGSEWGAAANPRILSRIPGMRLGSFAFPSVTAGEWKDLGVSLSPRRPLWGEFSQFRGTLSGNLCPLKWAFFFSF